MSVFSLRSGLLSLHKRAKLLPTELIPRTIALYVPHMHVNTYLTSSSALHLAHLPHWHALLLLTAYTHREGNAVDPP